MTPEEIRKQMMISAGLGAPKSSPMPAESSAPAEPETHVEVLTESEQVSEENSPIDDAVASGQDNALEASPAEPIPGMAWSRRVGFLAGLGTDNC